MRRAGRLSEVARSRSMSTSAIYNVRPINLSKKLGHDFENESPFHVFQCRSMSFTKRED
jgi:hypothetical protein